MTVTGIADIDFGAFPGNVTATLAITGQTGFNATTSLAEAWQMPHVDTSDHTTYEQVYDPLIVQVADFVADTGFTIHAFAADGLPRYGVYKIAWVWT